VRFHLFAHHSLTFSVAGVACLAVRLYLVCLAVYLVVSLIAAGIVVDVAVDALQFLYEVNSDSVVDPAFLLRAVSLLKNTNVWEEETQEVDPMLQGVEEEDRYEFQHGLFEQMTDSTPNISRVPDWIRADLDFLLVLRHYVLLCLLVPVVQTLVRSYSRSW